MSSQQTLSIIYISSLVLFFSLPSHYLQPDSIPELVNSLHTSTGHLTNYERDKRMPEFYFDVGKWEDDLARRGKLMGEEDPAGDREKKKEQAKKVSYVLAHSFSLLCGLKTFFSS